VPKKSRLMRSMASSGGEMVCGQSNIEQGHESGGEDATENLRSLHQSLNCFEDRRGPLKADFYPERDMLLFVGVDALGEYIEALGCRLLAGQSSGLECIAHIVAKIARSLHCRHGRSIETRYNVLTAVRCLLRYESILVERIGNHGFFRL
jgi:hypothetical protein